MSMAQSFILPSVYTIATRPSATAFDGYGIRVSDIPNLGFGLQYAAEGNWWSLARIQSKVLASIAPGNNIITYDTPYPVGVVPQVTPKIIPTSGDTDLWDAWQVGDATNTQVTIRVSHVIPIVILGIGALQISSGGTAKLGIIVSAP